MTRIQLLCAALLLGLGTASTQAQNHAGSEFEIELVVFTRHQGMEQSRENWPAAPKLEYPQRWVDFQTPSAGDPSLPALAPASTRLNNQVAALGRGGEYRVHFHKAWRQVLQVPRRAPAILISGGEGPRGHRQLEGSVTLSVAQYLHLSSNLWFNEFTGEGNIPLPTPPRAADSEPMSLLAADSIAALPAMAGRVAVLREERRLRSGELHYIDHPLMGLLIEVRRVAETEEE